MEHKKYYIILIVLILVSSCRAPKYVPKLEEVPFGTHGSHIEIMRESKTVMEGELIAIDTTGFLVLAGEDTKNLRILPFENMDSFILTYAQPKDYAWTIPVYTASTISHGFLLLLTAPANIIVTSVVTARGARAFTYNEKVISHDDLRMFARFPQGIPPGINRGSIR